MADSDKTLKIQIDLQKTGDGATVAKTELDNVKTAASGTTEATKDLGKATKDADDKQQEATMHGRAQYLLMGELNKIVPELGHALHAAFAGPLGPIILAAGAIAMATSRITEYNASLDKAAEVAAEADFIGSIGEQVGIFKTAAADAQGFADAIGNIATNSDTLTTRLQAQLTLYQAIERAQASLVSAQKGLDIAEIQQAEATHKITPEQAAKARADAEKNYIVTEQQDREAAQDKELAAKQNALRTAAATQSELDAAQAATAAKVTQDKARENEVKLDPAEQLKKIQAAQAASDAAQKELDEITLAYNGNPYYNVKYGGASGLPGAQTDAQVKLDKAAATQTMLQGQLNRYNASQTPSAGAAAEADKDAAAEAKKRAEDNAKLQADLAKEIKALTDTIKATRPTEEAAVDTKNKTLDTEETTRVVGQFQKDFAAVDKVAREKHPATAALEQASVALTDLLAIMQADGPTLAQIPQLKAEIAKLKQDRDTIKAQLAAGSAPAAR